MRLPPLAAAAAAVLALTACGSDSEPEAAPPVPSDPSPSTPAPETAAAAPSASAALPPSTDGVRLLGDGVDLPSGVLTFGTPLAAARTALEGTLGAPTKDTGPIEPVGSYGTCPGTTLQVLEYGDGALQVLFGDVDAAEPVLHTWALVDTGDPAAVPQASALLGDVTTVELGVGTTVGELRQEAGEEAFQIREDELSLDPAFVVQDQSSGVHGFLTGTTDEDRVTFVEAGSGCGE